MKENYIAAYRSKKDQYPVSMFVEGDVVDASFPINNEWDLIDIVLTYCDPLDGEVVVKKTILDYNSYREDQLNLTLGMLTAL